MIGTVRRELAAIDDAVYHAVAGSTTPELDRYLQPLTASADYSRLWIGSAAALALFGGPRGRQAALQGLTAIALASGVVNQALKRASRRPRPNRAHAAVPQARHVPMPTSTSFPSGHAASAFAFVEGVSATMPLTGTGLRLLATTVAYTRVHAGVHYPGDVLAGAGIGVACGRAAPHLVRRLTSSNWFPAGGPPP